jgi:phi13 family phage major tail protein
MPNSGEYKSVVGVDEIHVALVTQDDASGYAADVPEMFAPATEISGEPTTNLKTQYADNKPFDVSSSEGETKLTIKTTAIPIAVLAKYLGKEFDTTTGRMYDTGAEATPPDAALSFRSLKSNGKQRYFQYLKGKFSVPKDEAATKSESPEPKPAEILFTAVNTTYKFDVGSENKSVKRVLGDEDSTNFSGATWFNQVQVPGVVTPDALTLTPIPAKAATGISKTAAFTLTFNNAMAADVINSITLLDATPAAVSITATLDATKKIVTVTHTALAGTTAHSIVVSGATDIYGQTISDLVKFTTAA